MAETRLPDAEIDDLLSDPTEAPWTTLERPDVRRSLALEVRERRAAEKADRHSTLEQERADMTNSERIMRDTATAWLNSPEPSFRAHANAVLAMLAYVNRLLSELAQLRARVGELEGELESGRQCNAILDEQANPEAHLR